MVQVLEIHYNFITQNNNMYFLNEMALFNTTQRLILWDYLTWCRWRGVIRLHSNMATME